MVSYGKRVIMSTCIVVDKVCMIYLKLEEEPREEFGELKEV